MTSEEAVEILRKIKAYATGDDLEALDMAIESIIYDYARGVQKGLEIATIKNKGEWVEIPHTFLHKCSQCDWINDHSSGFHFCPMCGSDMRGDDHD